MLNFMKTMVSAVKSWTEKKFDESTADWNQNDPTASNYIKNRTHWEEKREFTAIPETCIPRTYLHQDSLGANWAINPQIEPGITYTITFNGIKYESVGKNYNGPDSSYIGSHPYQLHTSEYPFSVVYYLNYDWFQLFLPRYGQYTISISYLLDGVETVIVPECTIYNFGRRGHSDFATQLVVGNVYKVIWDGIEYELTAIDGAELDQEGYVFLGTLGDQSFEYRVDLDGNEGNITFLEGGIHTISIWDASHDNSLLSIILNDLQSFDFPQASFLQVGTRYVVTIGDETYTCIGKRDGDKIYIGNQFFFNNSSNYYTDRIDTGEPFLISSFQDDAFWEMVWIPSEARGTVSVVADGTFIHKIDQKYIELPTYVATSKDIEAVASSKMDSHNPVGSGSFSMGRKSGTTAGYLSYARGSGVQASGDYSHADGYYTTALGAYSHAEGSNTTASGDSSHAEGASTKASGTYSHAEGYKTTASGDSSHAEGSNTTASGDYSHAEGFSTEASGAGGHAEGYYTTAPSTYSHAEGSNTTSLGNYSHAEGYYTTAFGKAQHTQGEYNIVDPAKSVNTRGKYAHIVGNGTSDTTRSNAYTLDWNGVGWYQGGLQVGGNAQDDGARDVLLEGDAIPVPEIAAVGQTVIVKAVDENGKPTGWEAANKPVYIADITFRMGRYFLADEEYSRLLDAHVKRSVVALNSNGILFYLVHVDDEQKMHFAQIPYGGETALAISNWYLVVSPDNSASVIGHSFLTPEYMEEVIVPRIPTKLSALENDLFYSNRNLVGEFSMGDWTIDDNGSAVYKFEPKLHGLTVDNFEIVIEASVLGESMTYIMNRDSATKQGEIHTLEDGSGFGAFDSAFYIGHGCYRNMGNDEIIVENSTTVMIMGVTEAPFDSFNVKVFTVNEKRLPANVMPKQIPLESLPMERMPEITLTRLVDESIGTDDVRFEPDGFLTTASIPGNNYIDFMQNGQVYYNPQYNSLFAKGNWHNYVEMVNIGSGRYIVSDTAIDVGWVKNCTGKFPYGTTTVNRNFIYYVDIEISKRNYRVPLMISDVFNQELTVDNARFHGTFYTEEGYLFGVHSMATGSDEINHRFTRLL